MDAADMCDVLHFFFEEDRSQPNDEAMAHKSAVRETMYPLLYGKEYAYKFERAPEEDDSFQPMAYDENDFGPLEFDPESPFDPKKKQPPKPYIAPTKQFDPDSPLPFGNVLDPPAH